MPLVIGCSNISQSITVRMNVIYFATSNIFLRDMLVGIVSLKPDAIPIFSGRRMLPFFGCHPESRQGWVEGSRLLVIEILRACGTQNDYIAVMLNPDYIGTGSFQDLDFVMLNPNCIGVGIYCIYRLRV